MKSQSIVFQNLLFSPNIHSSFFIYFPFHYLPPFISCSMWYHFHISSHHSLIHYIRLHFWSNSFLFNFIDCLPKTNTMFIFFAYFVYLFSSHFQSIFPKLFLFPSQPRCSCSSPMIVIKHLFLNLVGDLRFFS